MTDSGKGIVAKLRQAVLSAVVVAAGVGVAPAAASADVITPPGACVATGHWLNSGLNESSTGLNSSDVIKIPAADTVQWAGNIAGHALGSVGPRRPISGAVKLDLPIGSVTIDSWGKTSVRYANTGRHKYDLPSVLKGIKMKLHGEHSESGRLACSGSVYVEVSGTSPLLWGGVGMLVIAGGMLFFAGRPVFRKLWAFEDVNPG